MLSDIAIRSKSHWQYPQEWLDTWKADLTITDEDISNFEVFVLENNNAIYGFYLLIITDKNAELEHLWVDPIFIGNGVGKKLFAHAIEAAKSANVAEIFITSDPNAESFYEHMGAKRTGTHVSEINGVERSLPIMRFEI